MFSNGLCIPPYIDPQDFWILTTISAGMIGFALVTYTWTNPYNTCGVNVSTTTTGFGYNTLPQSNPATATATANSVTSNPLQGQRRNESLGGVEMQPRGGAGK